MFGFDPATTEEELRAHFESCGQIMSIVMNKRKRSCVMRFANAQQAESAVETFHMSTIAGYERFINVKIDQNSTVSVPVPKAVSVPKLAPQPLVMPAPMIARLANAAWSKKLAPKTVVKPHPVAQVGCTPGTAIYVFGFDGATTDEELRRHFEVCGQVKSLDMNRRKRKCVLRFANAMQAQAAVETLDKSVIDGYERYINVKIDDHELTLAQKRKAAEGAVREEQDSVRHLQKKIRTGSAGAAFYTGLGLV